MTIEKNSQIFVCYSHEDNESLDKSKRWLDRLIQHLKPLEEQGDLVVFSDKDINIGEEWHSRIQTQLSGAKAAILLVSPAFLASKYIANSEMPVLLKKANNDGLKIMPIHISPSNYAITRFKYPDPKKGPDEFTLASIQAAHSLSKTMVEMTEAEQNRVFVQLSKRLLEVVQERTLQKQEPTQPKDIIDPLTIEQNIKSIHVNRDEEIALFCDMIGGRSDLHILFIEAESGMGKTALLKQFLEMSKGFQRAKINFKNASYTFGEIFHEMCHQSEKVSFSDFDNQCRNFITNSGITVGPTTLLTSFVDDAMAELSQDERKTKRQVIIDAFFGDLAASHEVLQTPIVIFFDAFEKASDDVKDWIAKQFISRIRIYPWIICVVAGQKTPSIDPNSDWCKHSKLEILPDKYVIEYLHRLKLTQKEVVVQYIISISKEDPSKIKSLDEAVLFSIFNGFIIFSARGKPAELQQLALRIATLNR